MRLPQVTTTDDIDFAIVGILSDTCASYRAVPFTGPCAASGNELPRGKAL